MSRSSFPTVKGGVGNGGKGTGVCNGISEQRKRDLGVTAHLLPHSLPDKENVAAWRIRIIGVAHTIANQSKRNTTGYFVSKAVVASV